MAPLYSRYVPPKASSTTAAVLIDSNATNEQESASTQPVVVTVEPLVDSSTIHNQGSNGRKERKPLLQPSSISEESNGKKKRKRAETDSTPKAKQRRQQRDEDESEAMPKKHTGLLSKYQKASVRSEAVKAANQDVVTEPEEQPELHDLVPLPQPERAPTPEFVPSFSALPPWLAHPTVVSQSTTRPFDELSLSKKTLAHLESKGYTTAFAVQAALLPLLLPHPYLTHLPPNDVCVSAPTGSGKTLAYVLPIIESLRNRLDTKLRAVIVVPTRELVAQAYAVASTCAQGSSIQIALAVGNQSIAAEQETLVKKGRKHDPERYQSLMAKANKRMRFQVDSDNEESDDTMLDDLVRLPPNYVPTYSSAADLLICTPGRLVEHLSTTTGFNLDDVEWLVVDEADRLLDQSFQEWVAKVTSALDVQKQRLAVNPETHALRQLLHHRERYVRKIILSATMTRDISKLTSLKLRRPTMVVVKTEGEDGLDAEAGVVDGAEGFELPRTLSEFAVPVGDGSDKPLYLLELLRSKIITGNLSTGKAHVDNSDTLSDDSNSSSEDSDSSSDEESDSSHDSSSSEDDSSSDESSSDDSSESESESDSDSDSSSTTSSSTSTSTKPKKPTTAKSKPLKPSTTTTTTTTTNQTNTTILIFTPSTESASRLHALITKTQPSYSPMTTLLTKSSSTNTSSLLLKQPKSNKRGGDTTDATTTPSCQIIISTDRASRGLDLPNLTHVINYSIPRSLPSYIHRVGRTARAGKSGQAWTLFTENEGRWFWNEIARTNKVGRKGKVERVNLKLGLDMQENGPVRMGYEGALESIKDIVVGMNARRGKKGNGKKTSGGDVEMED